jgi:hypothetical protein
MMSFIYEYWPWLVIGIPVVAGLLAASYIYKNWHLVAVAIAIIGAIGTVGRAFGKGTQAERDRQKVAAEHSIKEIREVQKKVEAMPPSEVDRELRKWAK